MNSRRIDLSLHGIHIYESKHQDGDLVKEHHHQIHQILYALNGDGEIVLEGSRLDFRQDYGAVIAPYSTHSVISNSKLTLLVLAFDETLLDPGVQEELLRGSFGQSKVFRLHPFGGNELRQLLRKMLFEQLQTGTLAHLAKKIYLSEILLVMARSLQPHSSADANSLRAERLRHYIDAHYYEIGGTADLALKLGVSTRHINNIFKEQYQKTPIQYLTEVRMELAKKMLAEADKDIVSICFEVGFENISTFYRTFKSYTRMSPNTYRLEIKGS